MNFKKCCLFLCFLFASVIVKAQFTQTRFLGCGECKMRAISPVDLDMDGDLDLVMDNYHTSRIDWMTNDGKGNYSSVKQLLKPKINQLSFFAVDFDEDGDMDIFTDHDFSNEIYYHENEGDLTYKTPVLVKNNYEVNGFSFMAAEDFDLDGKKELIVSNPGMRGILFYKKLSNNTFEESVKYNFMSKGGHRFTVIDFDQDGDKDIVGQGTNGGFNFFENEGAGKFEKARTLMTFGANQYASSFDIGDVDGDGDYDIITGRYGFYTTLFYNDGNNFFPTSITIDINKNVNFADVYFSDVDGDGDLDIVLDSKLGTGNNAEHAGWYENFGAGEYSKFKAIFTNDQLPDMILPVDIDGDGDEDYISKTYSKLNMYYKKNLYNSPSVTGQIFQDENSNGIKDAGEKLLLNQNLLKINPEPVAHVISETEGFQYYVDAGYYTFKIDTGVCWSLTTPKSAYAFQITSGNVSGVDFGLKKKSNTVHIKSYLTSSPTRCGFTIPFRISTDNTGCSGSPAKVSLILDKLVSFREASPAPSLISGDTLWWDIAMLEAEGKHNVSFKMEIAGVEFQGDTINMPLISYVFNEDNQLVPSDTFNFTSVINCSYDPNDKLNYPNRGGKNYTLSDEELFYVIRFQNTGKDTAFTVELRDTLNANLDLRTLRTIESSHGFSAKYNYADREFRIRFDNILLPDSTTNEAASHGFFAFVVKPFKKSYKKVAVLNKAEIFFDFNPPVKTNSTLNTLVDYFSCTDSIGPQGQSILPMKVIVADATDPCQTESYGQVVLIPEGGIPPYFFRDTTFADSLLVDSLNAGPLLFSATDNGNCLAVSDSVVIILPEPLEMTIQVKDTVCIGESAEFTYHEVKGGTPPYLYQVDEEDIAQSTVPAGTHRFSVSDRNGCQADTTVHILELQEIMETHSVQLPASLTSATGNIVLDSVSGGKPPYSYVWSSGAINDSLYNLMAGIYTVTITDAAGCRLIREFDLLGPLATIEAGNSPLEVYPNPFSNFITVSWLDPEDAPTSVAFLNMDGKSLKQVDTRTDAGRFTLSDTFDVPAGIYFLKVTNKAGTWFFKMLRE